MTDVEQEMGQTFLSRGEEEFKDEILIDGDTVIHPRLYQMIADYVSPDTNTGLNLSEVLPREQSYNRRLPSSLVIGGIKIEGRRNINTREITGHVNILISLTVRKDIEKDDVDSTYVKIEAYKSGNKFHGYYYIKYVTTSSYLNSTRLREEKIHYESDGTRYSQHEINICTPTANGSDGD